MKWYLSKLIFQIVCGNGNHKPQFDEQLRLICAEDDLHAFHKARQIGESEGADETVAAVKWKFIDVSELHLLSEPADGAEIYSRINEEEDPETFIRHTKKRATALLESGLFKFSEAS